VQWVYSAGGLRDCSVVQRVYRVQESAWNFRDCSIVQGVYVSAGGVHYSAGGLPSAVKCRGFTECVIRQRVYGVQYSSKGLRSAV
jgi:hypothetical protein